MITLHFAHESTDVYFGRDQSILKQRERIKQKAFEQRRLHHSRLAAEYHQPDEPSTLFNYAALGSKYPDDGQGRA